MIIEPKILPQIISVIIISWIGFFALGWQLCLIICRPKLKRFKVKRRPLIKYYRYYIKPLTIISRR